MRPMRNRGVVDMIRTLAIVGVMLGVIIVIMSYIFTALPAQTTGTAAYNATTSMQSNFWSGITLAGVSLIVIGAAGIMSVVIRGFGGAQ